MVDILEWMFDDPAKSLERHYAIAGGGQPIYTWADLPNCRLWQMKSEKGFPWDCNSWDENFVYQVLTDGSAAAWSSPTTFHQFTPPVRWAPRFFNEGGLNAPLNSPSTYKAFTSCSVSTSVSLGANVTTQVTGPYSIDFGGDLGVQSAIIIQYLWGWTPNGYANMELNFYVKGFGLVEWQLWTLGKTGYTWIQTSLFNTLVPGGLPLLNAPCGVPA